MRLHLVFAGFVLGACSDDPQVVSEPEPDPTAGAEVPAEASPEVDAADAGEGPTADPIEREPPQLRLTFLDSGQGDCALIECPNGQNILVDCGSTAWGESSLEHLQESFNELVAEDETIDVLVVTHSDQDHYNKIRDVVGDRPITRAIHSRPLNTYSVGGFDDWLSQRTNDVIAIETPRHDDEPLDLFDCGGATIQILAAAVAAQPPHANDAGWISNGASIVLRLEYGEFSAILTGDATFDTEAAMLEHYANQPAVLDADLLRLGHHGTSVTSSSPEWLAAVTPEVAIVSAGHHGTFRHPRCAVTQRAMDLASTVADEALCHQVTCGVGTNETRPQGCPSGNWCEPETNEPVYDTFSSGDLQFVVPTAGIVPSVERGGCS